MKADRDTTPEEIIDISKWMNSGLGNPVRVECKRCGRVFHDFEKYCPICGSEEYRLFASQVWEGGAEKKNLRTEFNEKLLKNAKNKIEEIDPARLYNLEIEYAYFPATCSVMKYTIIKIKHWGNPADRNRLGKNGRMPDVRKENED